MWFRVHCPTGLFCTTRCQVDEQAYPHLWICAMQLFAQLCSSTHMAKHMAALALANLSPAAEDIMTKLPETGGSAVSAASL